MYPGFIYWRNARVAAGTAATTGLRCSPTLVIPRRTPRILSGGVLAGRFVRRAPAATVSCLEARPEREADDRAREGLAD